MLKKRKMVERFNQINTDLSLINLKIVLPSSMGFKVQNKTNEFHRIFQNNWSDNHKSWYHFQFCIFPCSGRGFPSRKFLSTMFNKLVTINNSASRCNNVEN